MGFVVEITSYQVSYSASPRIVISNGNRILGQLVFAPNGGSLPPDMQNATGQIELHYHLEDFRSILDILRSGKPVFVNFTGAGPGFTNFIQTGPRLV